MRIACLTHYYIEENRAGGELMLHALLKSLVAAGHEVRAYITDTIKPDAIIDGVQVFYDVNRDDILDTVEFDICISQFANAENAMRTARYKGKPFVFVVHNDMWETVKLLRVMGPNDLALYNTEWIKQLNYGTTRATEIVVHPPIDRKAFKTKTTGEYVSLVNLTKPKGVDIFIHLAKTFPDVKFLAVKGGYWKQDQVEINLPNVTVIENTPNMRQDVYAKSRIMLMPSTYETFGMVAAEAICSGIPVIATPTAGLVENLGDAGTYARRGSHDLQDWTAALAQLLNDPVHYAEMSRRSLDRSKVFNTPKELKAFVKAVENLVPGK